MWVVRYKLQKTSDMALGNEMTKRNLKKKTAAKHTQTLSHRECSHNDGIFCTFWHLFALQQQQHRRYYNITHELNIQNMQMPQVLQFISAYLNQSIAFCFIIGISTFSFRINFGVYLHPRQTPSHFITFKAISSVEFGSRLDLCSIWAPHFSAVRDIFAVFNIESAPHINIFVYYMCVFSVDFGWIFRHFAQIWLYKPCSCKRFKMK